MDRWTFMRGLALVLVAAAAGFAGCASGPPPCDAVCLRVRALQAACVRGDAEACASTGDVASSERGCALGNARACVRAVDALDPYSPRAVEKQGEERERIERFLGRACDLGDVEICARVGVLALARKDGAAARPHLQRACDGGDQVSCYRLAGALADGVGLPAEPARALAIHEAACAAHQVGSCDRAAYFHYAGIGAPREGDKAIPRFEAACRAGGADSCALHNLLTGQTKLGDGPFLIGRLETRPVGAAVHFTGDVAPPLAALVTLHTTFSIGGAISVKAGWSGAMRGHARSVAGGVLVLDDDRSINVRIAWGDGVIVAATWPKPDPALDDAACSRAPLCKEQGACRAKAGYCAYGPAAGCAASDACKYQGLCDLDEAAAACRPSDGGCRRAAACTGDGRCTARADACDATSAADCARSKSCRDYGRCRLDGDRCVVSAEGCAASSECRERRMCKLHGDRCDNW